MMLFMMLSATISMTLMMMSHPISILVLILIQTMNMCLIIWVKMSTSWLSYILFLIFLGGLMVLFMYITSLASNEKFELNVNSSYNMVVGMSFFFIITFTTLFFDKIKTAENITIMKQASMLFSTPMFTITFLIMTYLLMTLIIAVKITSKFEGPLRSVIKK
uniref:NADH-ubiquinone oxidoreductase chain 6 n=1 Tax=Orchesella villosa TaxID=48706 RepID=B2BSD5_ORCVL|nr:NADH dehydrogenase subunit 6 [Orchesella villosa]ABS57588.1 NADH dehydrogenase subunit 6 [Orchesella villosa]